MKHTGKRDQFGSRLGFILASAGSAVGLGNIWRFPYVTGENGGAAFVFIYLLMVFSLGFTVMLAEFTLGRKTQRNNVGALMRLGGKYWSMVGWLGIVASIIILSFYGVIGGWTIKYFLAVFQGLPTGTDAASQAGQAFEGFISNSPSVILYQGLFMVATIWVVSKGIGQGIERFCKVLMPALFIIMIILVVRAVTLDGAMAGIAFYLKPDFSKVTGGMCLAAMGQAFFSLSLGNGGMLTYGSYLRKEEPLPSSAFQICVLDSLVAFLSGLIIFPAVFAFGFEPGSGAGLTFVTLPAVFSQMFGGVFWAGLFFLLLVIASLTSSVNMLEVVCAHFIDEKGWSRTKAPWAIGFGIFLLGVPSAFSLAGGLNIFGKSFLDTMDFIASNLMMPLGGLFIVLFTGWVISDIAKDEVTNNGQITFSLLPVWQVACKVVAPLAVGYIFFQGLSW
ncbi:sodium-dependent transporter [Desulfoluna sp.]|uniref:sodium-dependent transporter n=1 Tax=Desulfoluna sp. TaxID=2045199 RepID=UPI00260E710D|nr:sodium-dependent transporter [Desulfoluna sp.]